MRKRQFLRFLTDGPDDANTAIVFAFAQGSEEGAPPSEFRLLSGETINIREMQYACLDEEVQCILIICRPDKALAGVQAARMIDTAIKTYTSAAALDRAMPMRRFVELLRTQRSSLKAEHITITVLSPGPNGNAAYSITSQLGTFD